MILSCGEALIDMLPGRTEADALTFRPTPGGAVFNTAIALARLGAPSGLFTGLSTDLFGQMLGDRLRDDGVHTGSAARSDRPTTLAFVTLTDGQADYAFYDENTAGRMLSPTDLPNVADADAYFFGGISLVTEPCADAYAALAARAHAAGKPIMLDPNIRPGFITDDVVYRNRLTRMIEMADIVKVSDEDLDWLMGEAEPDAARALLDRGPSLVCLTEGAEGVTGLTRDKAVRVAARKTDVVDTVGAGDTFNAGLLTSLHEAGAIGAVGDADEETIRTALDLGVRAAAITVGRAGADPPRRDEL